ncbi:MAG: hypothetical protein M1270_06550, partial [Gammaproteobacteria bacterium]|nr:hypothetical protein [Gammaproteobacteria bacterium]
QPVDLGEIRTTLEQGGFEDALVADSVVQTMQYDAAFMLNHLKNDLVFDGQKGDNTNFRENGQLRQILLLVNNDNKIVAEAPLRGFDGGLDSLGKVTCK